jgi:hypothetical protein
MLKNGPTSSPSPSAGVLGEGAQYLDALWLSAMSWQHTCNGLCGVKDDLRLIRSSSVLRLMDPRQWGTSAFLSWTAIQPRGIATF